MSVTQLSPRRSLQLLSRGRHCFFPAKDKTPVRRRNDCYAASPDSATDHWNVAPSIHMRCIMTASLRATATVAPFSYRCALQAGHPTPSEQTISPPASVTLWQLRKDRHIPNGPHIWRSRCCDRVRQIGNVSGSAPNTLPRYSILRTWTDRQRPSRMRRLSAHRCREWSSNAASKR